MKNSSYTGDNVYNLSFLIAGIYLVLIGVTGGVFNIIAFVKACQVEKYIMYLLTFRAFIILNYPIIKFYTF